jgi:hypothetical protein
MEVLRKRLRNCDILGHRSCRESSHLIGKINQAVHRPLPDTSSARVKLNAFRKSISGTCIGAKLFQGLLPNSARMPEGSRVLRFLLQRRNSIIMR